MSGFSGFVAENITQAGETGMMERMVDFEDGTMDFLVPIFSATHREVPIV